MNQSNATSAFVPLGSGVYKASVLTRGPWHPQQQHAGPPIALVSHVMEAAAQEHGLGHLARLTANLLRPVPISDIEVLVQQDYVGRNAGHFSAVAMAEGKELIRATALFQREDVVGMPDTLPGHPLAQAPQTPHASATQRFPFAHGELGYPDLVETRVARGQMFAGPSAVWFRMNFPLVEGSATSAYQRVAVAADSGNGISAILDLSTHVFVNSDLTINLLRKPIGEWVCLDARTHLSNHGGGLAESALYDEQGLIGRATQSLFVRPRA
jgi:acyl-CoA thioesterase